MAKKPSAKVVLHRESLDRMVLAVADGFHEAGMIGLEAAKPPDAEPYGKGLVTAGGTTTYVHGKKTAGYGQDGKQPAKPRALNVRESSIVTIVGFGFPGRFQEEGTARHPAQPFLTPAMLALQDDVPSIVTRHARAAEKR